MGLPVPSLPRMLGRYALYEKIASGGMASVHLGRLLGPIGFARTVAIKRMHPQFAEDPEFVSMFLDEARLAARIRHPNVVATLDVVSTAGELFLVMEFVQGEPLSRLVRAATERRERIAPEIVATILVGALHGLHAAHEATSDRGEPLGVVHRDVSPHNVLVGADGVSRVLDFGVAKAAGRIQTTREGQLKGKLAYMAPEQIQGHVARTTDVYAASVVLWEALTGRRLFQGENEAHVLHRVLEGCTVPPSTYASGVPKALDVVTLRGLRIDPRERFATARDMARAIEDAIPLATASRIGDWVEALAKETLGARSARIASIESDSSVLPVPPLEPTLPEGGGENATLTEGQALDRVTGTASLTASRRPKAWFAAAAGFGVLLAGVLLMLGSPTPTPVVASPTEPVAEPTAVPPPPPLPEPSAAASGVEASPPRVVATEPPAVSAHEPPRRVPVRPRAPAPSAKPAYNPLEHL